MSIGASSNVSINTLGNIALVVFDATAGQRLSAYMSNFGNGYWYFAILNPDSSILTSYVYLGTLTSAFLDPVSIPLTGTYTVEVVRSVNGSTGGTGTVSLYNVVDQTGAITMNGPGVSVSLTTPGQNGLLTFSGTPGQKISANFLNATFTDCWAPYIINPDGTQLTPLSGFCGSSAFIDSVTLALTGTYTLRIDPVRAGTGSVTAYLYNVVDQTGTININGAAVPVNLTTPGQNAYLTFSGTRGQQVSANFSNGTVNGTWRASIVQPNGFDLAYYDATGSSASLTGVNLPVTGTYTVKVDPFGAAIGSVTATLTSP